MLCGVHTYPIRVRIKRTMVLWATMRNQRQPAITDKRPRGYLDWRLPRVPTHEATQVCVSPYGDKWGRHGDGHPRRALPVSPGLAMHGRGLAGVPANRPIDLGIQICRCGSLWVAVGRVGTRAAAPIFFAQKSYAPSCCNWASLQESPCCSSLMQWRCRGRGRTDLGRAPTLQEAT